MKEKTAENQKVVPDWAKRAKAIMKSKKITQNDIALELDLERATVSHYLNGYRTPSVEQIEVIAKMLGVVVSQLTGEIPLTRDTHRRLEISRLYDDLDEGTQNLIWRMIRAARDQRGDSPPEER